MPRVCSQGFIFEYTGFHLLHIMHKNLTFLGVRAFATLKIIVLIDDSDLLTFSSFFSPMGGEDMLLFTSLLLSNTCQLLNC